MEEALNPDFTPYIIHEAYCQGAFPMAENSGEIRWYMPYKRALFPIEGIHVSKSLAKFIKNNTYSITFNRAFEQVMRSCLRPKDNWISEEMIRAYTLIHHEGWAHSCEVWRDKKLLGGIYGLQIGTCFSAESMFHLETNASKLALWAMVNRCRECGYSMFDAQIMNPHLASLRAYEIEQEEFVQQLSASLTLHPTPI
jgi:leucyl/phenylalanyl-tRNA--protein transferase